MKRAITLLLTLSAIGLFANAQEDWGKKKYTAEDRAYHSEDEIVVHERGWVRNHLLDDWFFELQGGGPLYYGTDDREGPFGDRLTGNLGYYYDYNDDLLIQRWRYVYFGGDIFMDLALLRPTRKYVANARYNNVVYMGLHNRYSFSETDSKNHRTEYHLGYIFRYHLTPNWSLLADVRGSFIERLFDREWVPGVETSGFALDFVMNAQVGICYQFHVRDNKQRSTFNRKDPGASKLNTVAYITYVKMEDTIVLRNIDTLLVHKSVNTPTPETQHLIDSLQQAINDKLNRDKMRAMNMPLDSILINRLLPYEMVFFELDKWDILASEDMKIDKMARIMEAYPDENFILMGSADSKTGTEKRNEFLSHRRADVVYDRLVLDYGIDEKRLKREYLGGILEYTPFPLNRCTVIIMDHPAVRKAFEEMKAQHKAGGGSVKF